jgi:hypothetical protein
MYNIKIDGKVWSALFWLRIGNAVLSLRDLGNAGKLLSGCTISGLLSSARFYGVSFVNTNGRTSPIRGAVLLARYRYSMLAEFCLVSYPVPQKNQPICGYNEISSWAPSVKWSPG